MLLSILWPRIFSLLDIQFTCLVCCLLLLTGLPEAQEQSVYDARTLPDSHVFVEKQVVAMISEEDLATGSVATMSPSAQRARGKALFFMHVPTTG
jgi:hypothetical protein